MSNLVTSLDGRRGDSSAFSWEPDQEWPRTSASESLIFIDETQSLARIYEEDGPDDQALDRLGRLEESPTRTANTDDAGYWSASGRSPSKRTKLIYESNERLEPPEAQTPHISPLSAKHDDPPRANQSVRREFKEYSTQDQRASEQQQPYMTPYLRSTAPLPAYTHNPAWPLAAPEEGRLMRYYVCNIANWFDVCDSKRHFATVLPQRAAYSPPLLCAIFTVAAKYLSLTSSFDPIVAHRYHAKCLEHLNHVISDQTSVADENLFAAIVVLRFLEEVDGKSDLQRFKYNYLR